MHCYDHRYTDCLGPVVNIIDHVSVTKSTGAGSYKPTYCDVEKGGYIQCHPLWAEPGEVFPPRAREGKAKVSRTPICRVSRVHLFRMMAGQKQVQTELVGAWARGLLNHLSVFPVCAFLLDFRPQFQLPAGHLSGPYFSTRAQVFPFRLSSSGHSP